MLSIDNSAVLDYAVPQNILNASVAFAFTGGSGYTSAPSVSFTGGGGSGAAATAIVTNGRVTGLTITNGGTGYTSVPTIAFTGGGGTGAAATAVLTSQVVTSATVTNGGTGDTIAITDNTGYDSGDSRAAVNIYAEDKLGNKKEYHIGVSPANVTIDILADGLNPIDGIDLLATVVSVKGKIKDGSVSGVGTCKTAGNFVMEK